MTSVGVVTGAGSGMGAACATRLVGDVDVLILADRNADAVATVTTNVSTGWTDHRQACGDVVEGNVAQR